MSASNERYLASAPAARLCRCDEPFGDPREGTCCRCGHQVRGYEIPARVLRFTLGVGNDRSTFAQKSRKYRPAA